MLILIRRLGEIHPFSIAAWVALISAPILLLVSLLFETDHIAVMQNATATGWSALLYTAIMSSVVANSGLYFLLQRYPVYVVTPFALLSPVCGVIGGLMFLDDVLTTGLLIGGAMILMGVAWINWRGAKVATSHND